jgi:DNA-binding transcriptional LysR family regulator
LVAVLDHGSITEAAARLHMSQPALSHQLAALEREIGTSVVERLPRGVRPTTAGRAMAADARAALDAVDRAVKTGVAVASGAHGVLRIACAETMTAGLLAPVLRVWRRRRPGIQLQLTEASSADALGRAIDDGTADIAIGPQPSRLAGPADVIGREEIVVVLPPEHPLAADMRISFEQLHGRAIVHYHPDNGLGGWLDERASRYGTTLAASMRTRSAATAAQLAFAGLGIALVPTTALTPSFPGTLRRMEPVLDRDIVALIANPTDELAQRFQSDLRQHGVRVPARIAKELATPAAPGPRRR